jgi:hypothetical protein
VELLHEIDAAYVALSVSNCVSNASMDLGPKGTEMLDKLYSIRCRMRGRLQAEIRQGGYRSSGLLTQVP